MAENPDDLIRPAEAAAILGVSTGAVSYHARIGDLPYYRKADDPLHRGWRWYRRGDVVDMRTMKKIRKLMKKLT